MIITYLTSSVLQLKIYNLHLKCCFQYTRFEEEKRGLE